MSPADFQSVFKLLRAARGRIGSNMTNEEWSPGFTAYPPFQGGVSPYVAKLEIIGGNDIGGSNRLKTCVVDWQDGSVETVPLTNGVANVIHTYTYEQGDSKYYGHAFFPTVTFTLSDGTTRVFNTADTGRCIVIDVTDKSKA